MTRALVGLCVLACALSVAGGAHAGAFISATESNPHRITHPTGYTGSGGTARLISDYRPSVPIYAFTNEQRTFNSLALYWGVVPIFFEFLGGDDAIFAELDRALLDRGIAAKGDRVAITMGWPLRASKSANMLKIQRVGDSLPS